MPRRTGRAALVGVASLLLAAACTAGPSQSPPILVRDGGAAPPPSSTPGPAAPRPLPPLEQSPSQTLPWTSCTGLTATQPSSGRVPVQCARISVPLDSPATPGRGQQRLTVLRAGTGPAPVVVVSDVDGVPGTSYAAALAASLPAGTLDKITLIGFDRRGTGTSDPVRCVPPDVRQTYFAADPAALDVSGLLDAASSAGQQCTIALENQLLALDTWRSAGDVDQLRQALGLHQLSAIGRGEGSRVLEVFADRFPDKVGRLVLDGVPEPSQDAVQALQAVADGAQQTLAAFGTDCVGRGRCPLGEDPTAALSALVTTVRDAPLVVDGTDGVDLGPGQVLEAVLAGLRDRSGWPALATALAKARDGNGTALAALLAPLDVESKDNAPRFDVATVTGCNDTKSRLSPDRISAVAADWKTRYPVFGPIVVKRLALCAPWTVTPNPPGPVAARAAPPILVLATAADPVTPLSGTAHAATALATGVLVTWQGAGHGALITSKCGTSAATGFLLDGIVPHDGAVCPP